MANPQAQMSPPPFSPTAMSPNPISPTSSNPYPPNKRPRLSPTASPYGSPQMSNGQLPNPPFSPQYDMSAPNGHGAAVQADVPITPTGGSMGPPSRPVEEKAPGIDDLSDVLFGSGIDIREEETALQGRNMRQQLNTSFNTQSTSFTSTIDGSQQNILDSHAHPYYSGNLPGGRESFYGAGTFNQPVTSPDVVHRQADEAKRERIRQYNIRKQFELNDPFLLGQPVWNKLQKEAQLAQIKIPAPSGGLPQQHNYRRDVFTLGGPQTQAPRPLGETHKLISSEGVASDALTLISLAARERIRMVLEDAGSVARGRRGTAHGTVAPELVDIAEGAGKSVDAIYEEQPKGNTLKRSYSEANALPSPVSDDQTQPKRQKTIAYPNNLADSASKAQDKFKKIEEIRAERRGKRKASGVMAGEQSRAVSTAGTPTPGTPTGDVAPRVSKKEQKRQADARANEAQQHAATSNAVNMALGGGITFGMKKKKISWMTSKQPATDSFTAPKRQPSSQQTSMGGKGGVPPGRTLGSFREDKEDGKGIQLRDVVHILEPDLREKRSLARAFNRLTSMR